MRAIHFLLIIAVFFDLQRSNCEHHGLISRTTLSKTRQPGELPSAIQVGHPSKTPNDGIEDVRIPSNKRIRFISTFYQCKDKKSFKTTRVGVQNVSRRVRVKRSSNFVCNKEVSCINKCSQTRQFTYFKELRCYCDNDCEFFQDCCADFQAFCGKSINATSAPNISGIDGQFQNYTESPKISPNRSQEMNSTTKDLWNCFPYKFMIPGTKGIWMIGSCRKSWPKDDIFYKYTNLSTANTITKDNYQHLPVYTSDGTVYHNRFCAECNGENLNKTKSYDLVLSPSCNNSMNNLGSSSNGTNCTVEGWMPAFGDPRRYCLDIKSTCNASHYAKECTEGKAAIVSNKNCIYKNRYCALCNSAFVNFRCGPNATSFTGDCVFPISIPPPFAGLHHAIDFSSPLRPPLQRSCEHGMVFDVFAKLCRETLTASKNTTQNCSDVWVLIKDGEFLVLKNQSILLKKSNMIYESSRYIWRNNTLYICANFSRSYQVGSVMKYDEFTLELMTYICMTISIICLVFVLITYSLFSELRTPPGINLMNLSVSILLAQLLWLLGSGQSDNPILCTAIAVLLHYLFLVSFMWTSIIAFDTWRAFTAKGRRTKSKSKIVCYMAVGWLSVVIYLAVCVTLDLTSVTRIGYQGDKVCWMSNALAVLYFFAIPIALLLVFNVVLYCLTARAIYTTKAQARFAIADKDRKKSFGIYVRIASAMGFTWIFGFIAPFGLGFLWYAFVFFNSLQGVYIAAAFVFNKRVMRLYKNLFSNSVDSVTRNVASLEMNSVQISRNGKR